MHPQRRLLKGAWSAAIVIVLLIPLLPIPTGSSLKLAAWLSGYLGDLSERWYGLIKTVFLWVPVGFAFSLAGRDRSLKLWAMCIAAASVPIAWALPKVSVWESMELLFALPGLALGLWAGNATQRPVSSPSSSSPRASPIREYVPQSEPAPRIGKQDFSALPLEQEHRRLGVGPIALAFLLLAPILFSLLDFPRGALGLAVGYSLYAALLLYRPQAWLVVVPAALPLLDLAPWTGRYYFDEFDRLLLVTVAMLVVRGGVLRGQPLGIRGTLLLIVLGLSLLTSAWIGLSPIQPWDANAFSSYLSHYNSLRVAKGFVWGATLFWLIRRTPGPHYVLFAAGTALGLAGVAFEALREAWLFGALRGDTDYRVTATFSSMHTGGGHIEAYLVCAIPLVAGLIFKRGQNVLRIAALAIVLASIYALTTTVARGGIVGLVVVMAVLGLGLYRTRSDSGIRGVLVIAALTLLAGGITAVGMSGTFFQQRWMTLKADAATRVTHWGDALALRNGEWLDTLFGMGMGSFPRAYFLNNLDKQLGSASFAQEGDNVYLKLNSGGTLYEAQLVATKPNTNYRLQMDLRSDGKSARMEASLCEKRLFNSARCQWLAVSFPPDEKAWLHREVALNSQEIGSGQWWNTRPVQLSLYNPGEGSTVQIDNVRLLDEAGTNLIANGDFSRDGDYWFFKSGDHLPWHIKNLWVHLLYELGWVGLILITFLLTVSLWRLGRSLWRGELERTMMLAALAGLLTVGVVDSLVDAPRLGMLLCFLLLAGAWNTDFKQPDKTGNAMNGSSRSRSRTGLSSKSHHLRGYTHAADVSHHPRGDYVSGTVLSPTTSGNRKK